MFSITGHLNFKLKPEANAAYMLTRKDCRGEEMLGLSHTAVGRREGPCGKHTGSWKTEPISPIGTAGPLPGFSHREMRPHIHRKIHMSGCGGCIYKGLNLEQPNLSSGERNQKTTVPPCCGRWICHPENDQQHTHQGGRVPTQREERKKPGQKKSILRDSIYIKHTGMQTNV